MSAPYESGSGKVYIFSGDKIRQSFQRYTKWKEELIELKPLILRGENEGFGLSLHVLPDIDDNGCDGK